MRHLAPVLCAAASLAAATALASSAAPAAELPVSHTVVRIWERGGRLDLATLKPVAHVSFGETWVDRGRSRTRISTRRDGLVVEDFVCAAPVCSTDSTPTVKSSYRTSIQASLRSSKAHVVRTGVLRGRHVRWIQYGKRGHGEVVVLDPAYRVVRDEYWDRGQLRRVTETVVAERVPRRESDFVPHPSVPEIAGQSRPEGRLVESGDAARAVPEAQWAGESLGALKLNAIRERPWSATTKTGEPLSGTILHLRYGDWLGSFSHPRKRLPKAGVEITEASADSPARWWLTYPPGIGGESVPPPKGFVDIHDTQAYVKLGSAYYPVAVLQKDGVWMVVRATSWPLLQKTLRSLKPIS